MAKVKTKIMFSIFFIISIIQFEKSSNKNTNFIYNYKNIIIIFHYIQKTKITSN